MKTSHSLLKQVTKLGLVLMIGASINANAGLFGISGASWKEEVLLHDESKIIVKRSQSYGGRGEIGQGAPIREYNLSFMLPNSNQTIEWKSEYSKDVGRANLHPLALHVLNGTPYIVFEPNLCLAYNKWGRPNPPYVIFKYDGKEWQRITIQELPVEFKDMNLVNDTKDDAERLMKASLVTTEEVKQFNSDLKQPEHITILREPVVKDKYGNSITACEELVFYKGAWVGPGDSIGKRMMDMKSK